MGWSAPPTAATPRIEGEYLESEYLGSTLLGKKILESSTDELVAAWIQVRRRVSKARTIGMPGNLGKGGHPSTITP